MTHFVQGNIQGLEKRWFVSCSGPEKNRVGRLVTFFLLFYWSKMCFDWELGGRKKLYGRDFFE